MEAYPSSLHHVKNDLKAFIADYYEENSASRAAIKQIAKEIKTNTTIENEIKDMRKNISGK